MLGRTAVARALSSWGNMCMSLKRRRWLGLLIALVALVMFHLRVPPKPSDSLFVPSNSTTPTSDPHKKQPPHTTAPSKSLPNASTTPHQLWIPVTSPAELRKYLPCRHPIAHCCIGQGRRMHDRILVNNTITTEEDEARIAPFLQKWHKPLHPLKDILPWLDAISQSYSPTSTPSPPATTTTNNEHTDTTTLPPPCRLWFVGDSLSADHAVAAWCELTRHGYEWIRCSHGNQLGGPQWNESDQCMGMPRKAGQTRQTPTITRGRRETHFASRIELIRRPRNSTTVQTTNNNSRSSAFHWNPKVSESCPRVEILFSSAESTFANDTLYREMQQQQQLLWQQGGVMVWNWGVHCNQRGCVTRFMHKVFQRHLRFLAQTKYDRRWRIVWRETEPQHFDTPGGVYPTRGRMSLDCVKTPTALLDNFRNDEADAVLNTTLRYTFRIPVVRLWKALAPRADWHVPGVGDCTHYAYTPWRFYITWDGMYRSLKQMHVAHQARIKASGLNAAVENDMTQDRESLFERLSWDMPLWVQRLFSWPSSS
jgi:hypothetical protein